jgi:hypothetical protein
LSKRERERERREKDLQKFTQLAGPYNSIFQVLVNLTEMAEIRIINNT